MSEFKEKVFLDWYLKESHLGFEPIDHARTAWQHQQEKVEELQKLVNKALTKLDQKRDELWSKWKENADVQDQGAANAFEEAYWILEQVLNGENNE